MSEKPSAGDHEERGDTSQGGFSDLERPSPAQDIPVEPILTPPAEGETGPGRDDGLGQPDDIEFPTDLPVPTGDPQTESERIDLQ